MKNGQIEVYKRAQSIALLDKYNYGKTDFFKELSELVSRYMECDGITVDTYDGRNLNIVVSISVKKVKTNFRPLA